MFFTGKIYYIFLHENFFVFVSFFVTSGNCVTTRHKQNACALSFNPLEKYISFL